MTGTMRAVVWRGGRLDVETVPAPEPGPGEVEVRLRACGVCGTDLHFRGAGLWRPGHVPGHEMTGRVERLGDGASGPAPGTAVAVEPVQGCGACAACRAGRANVCPRLRVRGIHAPGGFAERIVVPASRVHPVPEDLPAPLAALAEPMAVVVHGLRRGGLEPAQRVLVLGAGAVGLLGIVAARALGAADVWASARYPHQAELARRLGAARVLAEDEARPEALAGASAESGIDLVLETVGGTADTLRSAVAAIRPGGAVSVVGLFDGDVSLPALPLLLKEGTLAWSNCYDHRGARPDMTDAIDVIAAHRSELENLQTHAFPLADAERAFDVAADKRAGAVKVSLLID